MFCKKDEIPLRLCRKHAAAPLQRGDFQWIPTLWHFNKTWCHIPSAQFGKRLKRRIWSWSAGTFGQAEIWSSRASSSWKHPAVPYEVLVDPLSMANPGIFDLERNANDSDKVRCVRVRAGWLWVSKRFELNYSGGVFAVRDEQLTLASSNSTTSRWVRSSTSRSKV